MIPILFNKRFVVVIRDESKGPETIDTETDGGQFAFEEIVRMSGVTVIQDSFDTRSEADALVAGCPECGCRLVQSKKKGRGLICPNCSEIANDANSYFWGN